MRRSRTNARKLGVERLESRELMAADVRAYLSGGQLNIEGTPGADEVELVIHRSGTTYITSDHRILLKTNRDAFVGLNVNMLGGNDRVEVFAENHNRLDSVIVNMGLGRNEYVSVDVGYADKVEIIASQANGATVDVRGSIDAVFIELGNGNDKLRIADAEISNLVAKTKKGNDYVEIKNSTIGNVEIRTGIGNDKITVDGVSTVDRGVIDGGQGTNDFTKLGSQLGKSVKVQRLR